jgi:hypothetical protein
MKIDVLLSLSFYVMLNPLEALYEHLHVKKPPPSFKACVDDDTDDEINSTRDPCTEESSDVPNVLQRMDSRCQAIIGLYAWHTLMSLFNQAHDIHPPALDMDAFVVEYIAELSKNGRVCWPEQEKDSDEDHKGYQKWLLLETNINFFLALLRACEYGMREVALREENYADFTGLPYKQCVSQPYTKPVNFERMFDDDSVTAVTYAYCFINLPATIIDKFDTLVEAFLCMAALPDETWNDLYSTPHDPTWDMNPKKQFMYNAFNKVYSVCCIEFDGEMYSNKGVSPSSFFEQ